MNEEQLAALGEDKNSSIYALKLALADARLEVARLTEQRNATDTYANRLAAERDRQRADIRRLVEALRGWHHPHPASCSLCLLLAEMKERYDA